MEAELFGADVVRVEEYDPALPTNQQRLSNGAIPLKYLSGRHRKIIELYIGGMANKDIAAELRVRPSTVSRILADPLVRREVDSAVEQHRQRLVAMSGLAVSTVADAMNSQNMGMRLRGVDRYAKLSVALGVSEREGTAEDYAKQLAEGIQRGIETALRRAGSIDGESERIDDAGIS